METQSEQHLSIVLPARNEAGSLALLLPKLRDTFPEAEIIVVDDASEDNTPELCTQHGIVHVRNPYQMGNGAAIKRGTRQSSGKTIVFMDADGQHQPGHVQQLLHRFEAEDLDMLIGARPKEAQAGLLRRLGNKAFNLLASWMTGQNIPDLTSGLRVVRSAHFREFLHLLPNGFSYPTTSTMAFFRSGYTVAYERVNVQPRIGKSHLNIWVEGQRFLVIIFKVGAMYSPMKLFAPVSLALFLFATLVYGYTYLSENRFTNMSALLYTTSLLTFMIGIVSEQITNLMFARRDRGSDGH